MSRFIFNSMADSSLSKFATEAAKQTEAIIFHQLNEFISRGLLVIERTEPMLVREPDEDKITMRQGVTLKLKDQEYIESLELENRRLKMRIETITKAVEDKL